MLLKKIVYLFEYIDDWEKFNKITLPEKDDFYSHLNMEDISDAHYTHAKKSKVFKIKDLGECHDLYVKSNTLLLANVFYNFQNMCLEIYKLDSTQFLTVPELRWQATLQKTKVKLKSFN